MRSPKHLRSMPLAGVLLATAILTMPSVALAGPSDSTSDHCRPGAAARPIILAQNTSPPKQSQAPARSATEVAQEVASLLQSCSYDGSPLQVDQTKLGYTSVGDAQAAVGSIMRYVGLPQNFDVVEGPVPNAAALIVLKDKTPRRVIAYNTDFMKMVRQATQNSDWASLSILAHEIGHHLSGHTLIPGGSQPPIELEADKFSGFVLHRMGAPLDEALRAMNTFVKDGPDGPTHPGRSRRVAAITEGWVQACEQTGQPGCAEMRVASAPAPTASKPAATPPNAAPAPKTASPPATPGTAMATAGAPSTTAPSEHRATRPRAPVAPAVGEVLPKPDPKAVPIKFGRFIYDEFGFLDPESLTKFEQLFFEHAQNTGVEIVTLIVKSLHGMSAEDYAQTMMRQLRVGKLDVGNGALVVIAPDQEKSAVALGPGVMGEMKSYIDNYQKSVEDFFGTSFASCKERNKCSGPTTENVLYSSDHIRRDTRDLEWTIRYASFKDIHAAYMQEFEAQQQGSDSDPAKSLVSRKIARVSGVIEAVDVPETDRQVNEVVLRDGYRAIKVRGPDDEILMLYVLPSTTDLQPVPDLEVGKTYSFVAREMSLSHNLKDAQSFEVLSFNLLR